VYHPPKVRKEVTYVIIVHDLISMYMSFKVITRIAEVYTRFPSGKMPMLDVSRHANKHRGMKKHMRACESAMNIHPKYSRKPKAPLF
jgi:hypothetical protein